MRAHVWSATVPMYVQEGRLWAYMNAHPSVHGQEAQGIHVSMDGEAACLHACACVWHGLWPLLLPFGREALQNRPDRRGSCSLQICLTCPDPDPLLLPAHVRAPGWTSEV